MKREINKPELTIVDRAAIGGLVMAVTVIVATAAILWLNAYGPKETIELTGFTEAFTSPVTNSLMVGAGCIWVVFGVAGSVFSLGALAKVDSSAHPVQVRKRALTALSIFGIQAITTCVLCGWLLWLLEQS